MLLDKLRGKKAAIEALGGNTVLNIFVYLVSLPGDGVRSRIVQL